MEITLDTIKAAHDNVASMITRFEALAARTITLPAFDIKLADGERYAGIIVGVDGKPSHHLVLVAGQATEVSWDQATAWADKLGAALPTRCEQALLYANLKAEFEKEWYWSSETHESNTSYAWYQGFNYGFQFSYHKSNELRARAVRRLKI